MWSRILALILKELRALLRDPAGRAVLIGPPLIQLMVFGYAASFDLNHVAYAVYDEDGGPAARQLLARFAGAPSFEQVATLDHNAQIAPLIDDKQALVVLHLPEHFSRDLLLGRPASVQLIVDGRDSNTAALALGDAQNVVLEFNQEWAAAHAQRGPPAQLQVRAWFNPNLLSRWFIVPGIVGLLMLLVTLMVTGLSVAREREMGTFDQLLVTPMNSFEILLGKAVPGLLIGAAEGVFIALMALLWFHVPFTGSVLALALGMLLFLLAAAGIGLMISSLALTQQQGLLGVFLFMVPAVILSGFASPIANMPRVVQMLTLLNPMRYFLVIVRGAFLRGDGVAMLLSQDLALLLIAVVSMGCAAWLFRRRVA